MAKSKNETSSSQEDKISTLPDSVLSHILSFLPTKHAVGTTILSTKWNFLWTSITNLDFDDQLFLHSSNDIQHERQKINFICFVNRVFTLLTRPQIFKFRLNIGHLYVYDFSQEDRRCVKSWISAAVMRGVQEMDLSISIQEPLHLLPRSLFTCNTLAVLKLEGEILLYISTMSVNLPNLKILHLISVEYENDESVDKLLSGCPVLEHLVIHRSTWYFFSTFSIRAPLLKSLELYFQTFCPEDEDEDEDEFHIDAPALQRLNLAGDFSDVLSFTNLPSLEQAYVDVYRRIGDKNIVRLLGGLSNVKILQLSERTMKALSYAADSGELMFHNLTRLEVEFESPYWKALPYLLKNSPQLVHLICNTF